MLLVGLLHGGLSDQAVENMANVNLHVLCFLGLPLEDDVPVHSVLSRFRTKLTKAEAWDALLSEINRQIEGSNLLVKSGCHVDGSVTRSPRKPKAKPTFEMVGDRDERDDEADSKTDMRVVEVTQPKAKKAISKVRCVVERTFGGQQHWFGGKILRYQVWLKRMPSTSCLPSLIT